MARQLPQALVALLEKEFDNIAGIVVSKRSQIWYEHYFHDYNEDDTIHVASVTKSIISTLVGIAIDHGFIKSEEQNVLDFFLDYQIKRREKNLQHITIKQLLTMTAPYKFKSEPYSKVYSSNDWTKAALDLLGGSKQTEDFKYTTVGLQVLSGLLQQATGQSVREFASKYLFEPLRIKTPSDHPILDKETYLAFMKDKHVTGWATDPRGCHTSGWGLSMTCRDMTKIGQLYLQNGRWNGLRIVSSEWIQKSTSPQSSWNGRAYGYLWWLIDHKQEKDFAAIGDGGNIIYINPNLNTVIAITSRLKARTKDRIDLIRDHITPLLRDTDD